MSYDISPSNFFQTLAGISPFLLGFFLILSSLFNQDIKGIIYLGGVLLATALNIPIMTMLKSRKSEYASPTCDFIGLPLVGEYDSPSPSSLFIGFTLLYLGLPMRANNQINFGVLIFIFGLLIIDIITKTMKKCTTITGAILGTLIGCLFGGIYYTLIKSSGYTNLLYFNSLPSNNVVCNKPAKSTFKCSVYKNGELISENIA